MKSLVLGLCLVAGSISHASLGNNHNTFDLNTSPRGYGIPSDITKSEMDQLNEELLENLYFEEVAGLNSESIARANNTMGFAAKCDSFATVKDMGNWGNAILNEMKRNPFPELMRGTSDLNNACPNYQSMSDEGRQVVWVMVINAMAHLESSCKVSAPAKGPNGSLAGLLQLHNGAEQKYAKLCRQGDGKTAEGTFRCGLSMLEGQVSRDNALFSRKSYWDVLRPQAKSQKFIKIQKALKNLSICKSGAKYQSSTAIENIPVPTPRPSVEEILASEPTTVEEAISLGGQIAE